MICKQCQVKPCACVTPPTRCLQCDEPGEVGPCPYRLEIFDRQEDCGLTCCKSCRDECADEI